MLGLFIVLYGLEGWYLHLPVRMDQNVPRFKEICTSLRGEWGKISLEQVPEVVLVNVLNAVKLF